MNIKILLVDDDPDILEFLSYNLKKEGYQVNLAKNGIEALKSINNDKPDLIIMDVMMPEMDGIETCERIRNDKTNENIIIVFLSARNEEFSQIAGYNAGADDYITKPVKPKILLSKIKSLLRRNKILQSSENKNIDIHNKIIIDNEKYVIKKDGVEIILPRKEFELIKLLASNPQKVFLREEIFSLIWGNSVIVGERTIDVHIRKIRKKLGSDIIQTVKGIGYKFVE